MNKHQLAKALDMNHHTVEFHVGRMQESGLIETRPSSTNDREALCFTENNVHLWDDETTRILFGRGTPRRVAAYLAEHPGANVAEIAGALDIAATTIRRHLRLLQAAQLVQHIRIDRDVIYHAEPELADWLEVAGNLGLREGGRAEEG